MAMAKPLLGAIVALLAMGASAQITGYTNVFPWYGSCNMKMSENLFYLSGVSEGPVADGYQRMCWTVSLNEECPLTIDGRDNPCCKGYMDKGAFVEANVYKLELAHKAQCRNHIEYGVGPHGPRLVKVDGSETTLKMNWEVYRLPNGNMANKVRFTGMDLTRDNGAGAQICYSVKAGVCTGLDNLCPTPGCKDSATLIEMDNSYRHQCCPITSQLCKDLLPGGMCPTGMKTRPGVNLNTFAPTPATPAAALEQCCVSKICDDYIAAGELVGEKTGEKFSSCPLLYDGTSWTRNEAADGNTVEQCCERVSCDAVIAEGRLVGEKTGETFSSCPADYDGNSWTRNSVTYGSTVEVCCNRDTCDAVMAAGKLLGEKTGQLFSACPSLYEGNEWIRNGEVYGSTVEECCESRRFQEVQKYPFPYCRCEGQYGMTAAKRSAPASGDGYVIGGNVVQNKDLLLPFRLSTNYTTSTHEGRPLYCFDLHFLGTVPAPAKPTVPQWCRAQNTLHRIEFLSKPQCTKKDFDTWFRMRDTGAMIRLSTEDQSITHADGSPYMNPVFNPFTLADFGIQRSAVKVIKIQERVQAAGYNWATVVGANIVPGGPVRTIGAVCLQPQLTGPCTNLREICGSYGDAPTDNKYFAYRELVPADPVALNSVRCEWALLEGGNQRCCPTQTDAVVPPPS